MTLFWELEYMEEDPKPTYISEMGAYNKLPTPNKETKMEEFYNYLFSYSPDYMEFKQIIFEGVARSAVIFYFFETAFALVKIYENSKLQHVRVFEVGCQHNWKEANVRSVRRVPCLHHYVCPKCGLTKTVDSSD